MTAAYSVHGPGIWCQFWQLLPSRLMELLMWHPHHGSDNSSQLNPTLFGQRLTDWKTSWFSHTLLCSLPSLTLPLPHLTFLSHWSPNSLACLQDCAGTMPVFVTELGSAPLPVFRWKLAGWSLGHQCSVVRRNLTSMHTYTQFYTDSYSQMFYGIRVLSKAI